ncbi:hypothetical protein HMPREF0724_11959 [Prescottella equi ATCC 33707]|uniref:Uncharacterized protein n=1 Tax=Prescottella equi ATCC 33707 TaxID=525370 RepID=F1TJ86_RHOHA|nr:hypothetical protein HMPREF0724_11959 [Prescottella equi ATCC 33707]
MEAIGFEAAELLDAAGVALGPGLSDAEFISVHERLPATPEDRRVSAQRASSRPRPKVSLAHRRPRPVPVPVRRVGEQRRIGLTDGRSQTAGRSSPSVSLRAMS